MSDGFGIENLPFGVARLPDGRTVGASRLGDAVLDLDRLSAAGLLDVPEGVLAQPSLNAFLGLGRPVYGGVRRALARLVEDGGPAVGAASVPLGDVDLLPPVAVGDFVDFSASIHHATRAGRLLRPEGDPLPPQWRHLPVAYHGRAGSIVVSGAGVLRPRGLVPGDGGPAFVPSAALDLEAEVGFVVGAGARGPLPTTAFADHVAGLVLVNDWSARDIQAYESRPLGPFNGKSFATSVSPWLVTLDALAPYRRPGPVQDPAPAHHLAVAGPWAYDVRVEVTVASAAMTAAGTPGLSVGCSSLAELYWTGPQLLAHATANGAGVRPGDLFASGTVSGPSPGSLMCLLEATERGSRPLALPDGTGRRWLEDGDTVTVRGWAGGDGRPLVSLGEVSATILPAIETEG
ncbi:MAG TPA: fumarylacetoacetate hydrolase family protein [Acidimicrobiales bacterium]|nr:fumarylacetoacetate hydrolase family protein [Acidimicrobiales bacterium]